MSDISCQRHKTVNVFAGHDTAASAYPGNLSEALLMLTACLNWCGSTGGDGSEERALPFWGGGFLGECLLTGEPAW